MEKILEIKALYKNYKAANLDIEVLKDINLSITRGEFISVMGPSGSGKSTLLYLLGGLDKPTKGSIRINGKELSIMKDKEESVMRRRQIGFVFQFYNLIPNLNVEENVMLPILLEGKRPGSYKKQLEEILGLVGLEDRRKHRPRELSGGQQQRVAIARALIYEINCRRGDYTAVGIPLLSIINLDSVVIEANVDQQSIKDVTLGCDAKITPETDKNTVYDGKVTFISSKAVNRNGETTIPVQITMENKKALIALDSDVQVQISTNTSAK